MTSSQLEPGVTLAGGTTNLGTIAIFQTHPVTSLALKKLRKDKEGAAAFPKGLATASGFRLHPGDPAGPRESQKRLSFPRSPLPSLRQPPALALQGFFWPSWLSSIHWQESPKESDSEAGVVVTPSKSSEGLEAASE